jgi:hypothetical protein
MCRALVIVMIAACGRVRFDPAAPSADASSSADASQNVATISHVNTFASVDPGPGVTNTFTGHALASGDTIIMQVGCSSPTAALTGVTVTAPGWTFTQASPIMGTPAGGHWSALYVATAPDSNQTSVTVTWSGATCNGRVELGDEFSNVDPTHGLDAIAQVAGQGSCTTQVATTYADDALWGSCYLDISLTTTGAGFSKGADDMSGDWSEYRITQDAAGTIEAIGFGSPPAVHYVLAVAALAPAPR